MPLIDRVDRMTPGEILADTEVSEFIAQMGIGIAKAQRRLTRNSVHMLCKMAQETLETELSDGVVVPVPNGGTGNNKSLISLGLVPPFYHFQHADLEVSLQLTMTVDRTTVVTVDTGFEYGNANAKAEGRITVKQSEAQRATGVVTLKNNVDAGTVVVTDNNDGGGAETVEFPGSDVVRGGSLSETARNLATALEALSTVHEAKVTVVPGTGNLSIVPDDDRAFVVDGNTITIVEEDPKGAVAYAQLEQNLAGTFDVTWTPDTSTSSSTDATFELHATGVTPAGSNLGVVLGSTTEATLQGVVDKVNNETLDYTATYLVEHKKFVVPGATAGTSSPRTIRFDFGKSTYDPGLHDNAANLAEVVAFMKANPTLKLDLQGHTDETGGTGSNLTLGLGRANTVKARLVAAGIPDTQLSVKSLGEGKPLGSNDAENRRVEFVLDRNADHPIIKLEAKTTGANRIEHDAGTSHLQALGKQDGHAGINVSGKTITIDSHDLVEGPDFNRGATPTATATALVAAIETQPGLSASSQGPVVTVGGAGSVAEITLKSARVGTSGNNVVLSGTGPTATHGFSGGDGVSRAAEGTTVTVGGKILTLVESPSKPLGAREFRLGDTAEETASNLATAIGTLPKTTTTVADNVITVTAPVGTTMGTSNSKAFDIQDARIGGPAKMKTAEKNTPLAMHANISVSDSRRYGLQVTGNSKITTRLVSLPAPIELLEEVKTFLKEG